MTRETREDQLAELEALRSVYDESHVIFEDGVCISGKIVIEMEPLSKPVTVYATTEKGRNSVVLATLSPVVFMFCLPEKYPDVQPELELECEWMSGELISAIHVKLAEVCRENIGMGVLFFCCEKVVEIITSTLRDLTELCLDGTLYGIKNNMTGAELLQRVTDSSAQSADLRFQSGCYDCEVCFQNKTGKQCLLFRPCQHVFCKDCVTAFFMEILSNQGIRPLGCLATSCGSLASQQTILSIIGEKNFERYERILLERALALMDDVVPCPRKLCQNPVLISEGTHNLGTCGMCGYSFCVLCYRAYHGIDGCQFNNEVKQRLITEWSAADGKERTQMAQRFGGLDRLQKLIDTLLNEKWIDGNSKPCPRCRIRIEKNDGCNKMQCSKCDAVFCWLCDCVLDKNNPYLHYSVEGASSCANRLFEGTAVIDDEYNEDFVIEWEHLIRQESASDDEF